jgi:hypothetical protein
MFCDNGVPISSPSPAPKNLYNLAQNSSWAFFVSLRFCIGFLGCDAEALGGRIPAVLLERVASAKKSPQSSQKVIFSGCASMVSVTLEVFPRLELSLGTVST